MKIISTEYEMLMSSIQTKKIHPMGVKVIPSGWYTLIDENGEDYRLIVFEDQLNTLNKMQRDKERWINDNSFKGKDAIRNYFGGFCTKPTEYDMDLLMDNYRNNEIPPHIYPLDNRKSIDPQYVVTNAGKDADLKETGKKLYGESEILQDLYKSEEEYVSDLENARLYLEEGYMPGSSVKELPEEWIPFDRTPVYDINELAKEVVDEMFGGTYEGISRIEWTDVPYRTYYGKYHYFDNSILINSVLNSPDVDREYVKFVIYHELLHRDYSRHDKQFYEKEHLFKSCNYVDAYVFLDGKMNQFDIKGM